MHSEMGPKFDGSRVGSLSGHSKVKWRSLGVHTNNSCINLITTKCECNSLVLSQ
jgi:hypothetical protein